jgi:hypothetical protein
MMITETETLVSGEERGGTHRFVGWVLLATLAATGGALRLQTGPDPEPPATTPAAAAPAVPSPIPVPVPDRPTIVRRPVPPPSPACFTTADAAERLLNRHTALACVRAYLKELRRQR